MRRGLQEEQRLSDGERLLQARLAAKSRWYTLEELLGDRELLEEMGKSALARAEAEFSIEREARALNDFYATLLDG